MSHDQRFKNLILDYPREALAFLAETETHSIDAGARIVPVRQEQLKERLGERFRELDIPLLVEWPDGRRAALVVVVVEEESDPARFSILRRARRKATRLMCFQPSLKPTKRVRSRWICRTPLRPSWVAWNSRASAPRISSP